MFTNVIRNKGPSSTRYNITTTSPRGQWLQIYLRQTTPNTRERELYAYFIEMYCTFQGDDKSRHRPTLAWLVITAIPSYSYLINQDWHMHFRMSNLVSNESTPAKTTMKMARSALWSVLTLPLISTRGYHELGRLSALFALCNGNHPIDSFTVVE